jgi:hypothetical protein
MLAFDTAGQVVLMSAVFLLIWSGSRLSRRVDERELFKQDVS